MSENAHVVEIEELLAAYAIDALGEEERLEVETLLAVDPELRAMVSRHHEVMAVVAEAVESAPSTPSIAVWEGIVDGIGDGPSEVPRFEITPLPRRPPWLSRIAVALSAAALAVSAVVGLQLAERGPADELRAAVDTLLRDPDADVFTMTAPEGGATEVRVVLGRDGIGYLYADTLPALDDDRTYQLWAIVDGAAGRQIISAGVIGNDPDISPFRITGDVVGLVITNEEAGGVVASTRRPTAAWSAQT